MKEESKVIVRRATLADAEALLDLAARIYYETFAAVNTAENMAAYISKAFTLPQLQSELTDPQATFFLAEVDKALGGYAKLRTTQPPKCVTGEAPIELVRFYVDRPWQGTELSSTLMARCLEEAKRQGFTTMFLGVWEHNLRAHAFYHKWDFVHVGQHIFQMGDDPQVDWWMMRTL